MKRLILVLALVIVVLGLNACSFSGDSLVGTHWRNQAMGTGNGFVFETATTGYYEIGLLGSWSKWADFTYTYDTTAQTGTCVFSTYTWTFTINGNDLTSPDVEGTYSYTLFS